MDHKKYTLIITLFICISLMPVYPNKLLGGEMDKFEPIHSFPNSVNQMISLTCSMNLNEHIQNSTNSSIEFAIQFNNNTEAIRETAQTVDTENGTHCYKTFNHTYQEWKSMWNQLNDQSFELKCIGFVNDQKIGYKFAKIELFKDIGYGQNCSQDKPCNSDAHLVCSNDETCQCDSDSVYIEYYKCYPKVAHNESCLYDKQCQAVDENSKCHSFGGDNNTCHCSDYYIYNGIKCYSSSWCDWFDSDWFSQHWKNIIIILIALSTGLCLLSIVLSVSFYFRLQARKAGNNPIAFKYPSSLKPKIIISKYFSHNGSDDKKELTSNDYLNKY